MHQTPPKLPNSIENQELGGGLMRSASGQIPVLCPHCGDEPLRLREEVNGLPKATHKQCVSPTAAQTL